MDQDTTSDFLTGHFSDVFQLGGSLPLDLPTYVTRQADEDLYLNLKKSNFCYVLASRQMGKSSLRVRTMTRMEKEGYACAAIDISSIGTKSASSENWYFSFLYQLAKTFGLTLELRKYWVSQNQLSPVVRMQEFIIDVVLKYKDENIIIFIDEIDTMMGLDREGFITDDFFASIRSFFNSRADVPALNRLNFVIIGVAAPNDLMNDPVRTPFNIGTPIQLVNFNFEQAKSLLIGFNEIEVDKEELLYSILYWTGGQPFLTQKLCKSIAELETKITDITSTVSKHVELLFLNKLSIEKDLNLSNTQKRIVENKEYNIQMLNIYQEILTNGSYPSNSADTAQIYLKLSGLVHESDDFLVIDNLIYKMIFTVEWLLSVQDKIDRPYAQDIQAWIEKNRHKALNFKPKELSKAIQWFQSRKDLSILEKEYYDLLTNTLVAKQKRKSIISQVGIGFISIIVIFAGLYFSLDSVQKLTKKILNLESAQKGELTKKSDSIKDLKNKIRINESTRAESLTNFTNYKENASREIIKANTLLDNTIISKELSDALTEANLVKQNDPTQAIFPLWSLKQQSKYFFKTFYDIYTNNYFYTQLSKYEIKPLMVYSKKAKSVLLYYESKSIVEIWDVESTTPSPKLTIPISKKVYALNYGVDAHIFLLMTDSITELEKSGRVVSKQFFKYGRGLKKASFTPDNQKIVFINSKDALQLYNFSTINNPELLNFDNNGQITNDFDISSDGKLIASLTNRTILKIWDINGNLIQSDQISDRANDKITSINFNKSANCVYLGLENGTIEKWQLKEKRITSLASTQFPIADLTSTSSGDYFAVASAPTQINIFNSYGNKIADLKGITSSAEKILFSEDGHYLFSYADKKFQKWEIRGFEKLRVSDKYVSSISQIGKSNSFLFGNKNGHVGKYTTPNGFEKSIQVLDDKIISVCVSPNQQIIFVASENSIKMLDANLNTTKLLENHATQKIISVQIIDNELIWIVYSNFLQIYNTTSGKVIQTIIMKDKSAIINATNSANLSQNIAIGLSSHKVFVYDSNGHIKWTSPSVNIGIEAVDFFHSSPRLCYAYNNILEVWNYSNNEKKGEYTSNSYIKNIKVSPDNSCILGSTSENKIFLWNCEREEPFFEFQLPSALGKKITSLDFTSDGREFIVITEDGNIRIWKVPKNPLN